jgi:hypothetical protein
MMTYFSMSANGAGQAIDLSTSPDAQSRADRRGGAYCASTAGATARSSPPDHARIRLEQTARSIEVLESAARARCGQR